MRKRVALARALALEPEILFLDEPTSGLDPIGARAFDRLVRTLCDSLGLTVFMVTHDLDTLLSIIDRVDRALERQGHRRRPGRRGDAQRASLDPGVLLGARAAAEGDPDGTRSKYTLVGASALVLLALLAAAIVWLRRRARRRRPALHDLLRAPVARRAGGAQRRAHEGHPRRRRHRLLVLASSGRARSRSDRLARRSGAESTRAVVDRNLLTGIATIRLLTPTRTARRPPENGERDPVIAEGASQLQQFSDTANQIAAARRRDHAPHQRAALAREPGGDRRDPREPAGLTACRGASTLSTRAVVDRAAPPTRRRRAAAPGGDAHRLAHRRHARRRGQTSLRDASTACAADERHLALRRCRGLLGTAAPSCARPASSCARGGRARHDGAQVQRSARRGVRPGRREPWAGRGQR